MTIDQSPRSNLPSALPSYPVVSIPSAVKITGTVHSEESLVIEGGVDGDIQVRNAILTIAQGAHVDGDIHGHRVHVWGTVRGNIAASERVDMAASARVTGNVSANHVVVADGAWFHGHIDMNRRTIAGVVARHKATVGTQGLG